MEHEWSDFSVSYILKDVRIVAILAGKGSIVVSVPELEIQEGRFATWGFKDGREHGSLSLDYGMLFSIPNPPEAERYIGFDARIVISGKTEAGHRVDIRGKGSIGHDDTGLIDGRFDDLPKLVCPTDEDLSEFAELEKASVFGMEPKGDFLLASYKA